MYSPRSGRQHQHPQTHQLPPHMQLSNPTRQKTTTPNIGTSIIQIQTSQPHTPNPSTLQTCLPLQSPSNPRNLLHHIPNLHPALTHLKRNLLAALEPHRHHGLLRRVPRQLGDFDVDVGWAGGGGGGGGAEEGEEEPAGAGGVGEGVEGCAEGGDRVDWDGHFGWGGGGSDGGRDWSVECGLRGL